jgi:hypothetical protein
MKKGLLIIASLLLCLSFTGIPLIAEAGCGADELTSIIPKKFIGEIAEVDKQSKVITVKSRTAVITVLYDDQTTLRKGTEKKTFDDIKTGVAVTVRYVEIGGKYVAKSIAFNP